HNSAERCGAERTQDQGAVHCRADWPGDSIDSRRDFSQQTFFVGRNKNYGNRKQRIGGATAPGKKQERSAPGPAWWDGSGGALRRKEGAGFSQHRSQEHLSHSAIEDGAKHDFRALAGWREDSRHDRGLAVRANSWLALAC